MHCNELVKRILSPEDKFLLSVGLMKRNNQKTNFMELSYIQHGHYLNLKGLGKEFYNNLCPWLKRNGWNVLGIKPDNGLESYWKRLGQIPISELPEEQRDLFGFSRNSNMYVRFL